MSEPVNDPAVRRLRSGVSIEEVTSAAAAANASKGSGSKFSKWLRRISATPTPSNLSVKRAQEYEIVHSKISVQIILC